MISMENVSIMVKIYKLFPEVSKMGKLFPNGLFGNNVKYSPLSSIQSSGGKGNQNMSFVKVVIHGILSIRHAEGC